MKDISVDCKEYFIIITMSVLIIIIPHRHPATADCGRIGAREQDAVGHGEQSNARFLVVVEDLRGPHQRPGEGEVPGSCWGLLPVSDCDNDDDGDDTDGRSRCDNIRILVPTKSFED